jgi:hypothetical protein
VQLLVAVMRQLGLTGFSRPQFLSRGGYAWMMLGVVVLASGAGLGFWYQKHPRPPRPGRLEITTCPYDARVMLDDRTIQDRTIIATSGSHTLTVTHPGYRPHRQHVWLSNERQQMHVALVPTDTSELGTWERVRSEGGARYGWPGR